MSFNNLIEIGYILCGACKELEVSLAGGGFSVERKASTAISANYSPDAGVAEFRKGVPLPKARDVMTTA